MVSMTALIVMSASLAVGVVGAVFCGYAGWFSAMSQKEPQVTARCFRALAVGVVLGVAAGLGFIVGSVVLINGFLGWTAIFWLMSVLVVLSVIYWLYRWFGAVFGVVL